MILTSHENRYLQSHSSTMHVHKTDNDRELIRNTNATISQPIHKRLQTILTSRRLNCPLYSNTSFFFLFFFFSIQGASANVSKKKASFKCQNLTLQRHSEAGLKINFCHSSYLLLSIFLTVHIIFYYYFYFQHCMSSQFGSVLQFDLKHVSCSYFCFYFHFWSSKSASNANVLSMNPRECMNWLNLGLYL